ncbi:hypothetical protein ATG66_2412 [Vibrio sp. ES.051]|uniref:hypothetical protein n=1 Tax=Vibrio sp. ES.051 TaxID=1761909 RepID=UPI000BF8BDF2|nr:hypothetical protein [Vibrio sp. ES.051]PFG56087.1 hypothetical protein ATG66_2412 [Vibrio sp. ES.051]
MNTTTLLSTLNFVYRAKVKAVCDASDGVNSVSHMSIDSSYNIQIEAMNCTNEEFAKRFFLIHGEGHLEGDGWLVLYGNSLKVEVGNDIEIPSDLAFNAMIEKLVSEGNQALEKLYLDGLHRLDKVHRLSRKKITPRR